MAKSSDCICYIIFIIFACYNLLIVVLPAMGLWLNSSEWGVHKPDQSELQLDQSRLPYSEHLGQIS